MDVAAQQRAQEEERARQEEERLRQEEERRRAEEVRSSYPFFIPEVSNQISCPLMLHLILEWCILI